MRAQVDCVALVEELVLDVALDEGLGEDVALCEISVVVLEVHQNFSE